MSDNVFGFLSLFTYSAGRYCEWAHKTVDRAAEMETFEEYLKTLRLVCEDGQPAYLNWTVAPETPDLVYYQVRIALCCLHEAGLKVHDITWHYMVT
jgi:hypothetical protein